MEIFVGKSTKPITTAYVFSMNEKTTTINMCLIRKTTENEQTKSDLRKWIYIIFWLFEFMVFLW